MRRTRSREERARALREKADKLDQPYPFTCEFTVPTTQDGGVAVLARDSICYQFQYDNDPPVVLEFAANRTLVARPGDRLILRGHVVSSDQNFKRNLSEVLGGGQ